MIATWDSDDNDPGLELAPDVRTKEEYVNTALPISTALIEDLIAAALSATSDDDFDKRVLEINEKYEPFLDEGLNDDCTKQA